MSRVKNFNNTGVATDGRLYAGDLNAIQDHYSDISDFTQTHDVGTLRVGDTTLQLLKYGAGEARLTGAFRADGIVRALGGMILGAFTTAQRDAIPAGLAPTGIQIFNTDTARIEYNVGTDGSRVWRTQGDPISAPIGSRPGPGQPGRKYWDTTNKIEWIDTGTKWIPNDGLWSGAEMSYAGPVGALTGIVEVKPGWLLENGVAVSRAAPYDDLFAAIGTAFGSGNGSTTFNVPNTLGRVRITQDGSVFSNRGQMGGELSHALTAAEVPPHDQHWHDLIGNITPAQGAGDPFSTVKPAVSQAGATPGAAHNNVQPYIVTGATMIRYL